MEERKERKKKIKPYLVVLKKALGFCYKIHPNHETYPQFDQIIIIIINIYIMKRQIWFLLTKWNYIKNFVKYLLGLEREKKNHLVAILEI